MAKTVETKKEKIISALTLWREFDLTHPLDASVLREVVDAETGLSYSVVEYNGRATEDGKVRIFAYFARPAGNKRCPAILLLKEADKPLDVELMNYFVQKGYAVLMPDYSGNMQPAPEQETVVKPRGLFAKAVTVVEETEQPQEAGERTVYPRSLSYANYGSARGMYDVEGMSAINTCWFEWTYVALYSLKFLRFREDVGNIGTVGIRIGGEVAWKIMLSGDVACGVTVNAAGWLSAKGTNRFFDNAQGNSTDERHRYIAGVDSQSYAPFVKCPVLMLCALSDYEFDYDRAYETYARIGSSSEVGGHAIVYSPDSGACIGQEGLTDMELFLEKNLKGREVFIPDSLNIQVKEADGKLVVDVAGDAEGIVKEMGICYAETAENIRSIYREWQCVYKKNATDITDNKISHTIVPFKGAPCAFVYAYAKYLNGFKVTSRILCKQFKNTAPNTDGNRMLFSGKDIDCFSVAQHEDYSIASIFLETEAQPKLVSGYGGIMGAYSVGGIKTYKISSPEYVAKEGAMLKFDVYTKQTDTIVVDVEVATENGGVEHYFNPVIVKGGGKWKRIILEAMDFKSRSSGKPLEAFSLGRGLSFRVEHEDTEYAITNILWL